MTPTLSGRLAQLEDVIGLAQYPNLAVKWSHAPAYLSDEPYPYRDLFRPLRRVIEAFGIERIMWASDYPHLDTSPPFIEDMMERSDMTAEERDSIMRAGSVRLYQLDESVIERSNAKRRQQANEARRLGQYRLTKRLGKGGMGEVYLAEHVLLRRPCAVKVIRTEQAGDPADSRGTPPCSPGTSVLMASSDPAAGGACPDTAPRPDSYANSFA